MKKYFSTILFYGALWGFLEATVGHILHFIPTTIAGTIMFPIASVILIQAYLKTNSKLSLLYIGIIASLIKSVDLLLPAFSIYKTINPMLSIIFEALLVVAVIRIVSTDTVKNNILGMQVASIGWRMVFVGYMAIQYVISGNLAPYISEFSLAIEFVVIQGVLSGLLATGLYFGTRTIQKRNISFQLNINPILSSFVFIAAIAATYFL